jgi:ElaA protein
MGLQKIKAFEELSVHELYDLLRLRREIFVVEQKLCLS